VRNEVLDVVAYNFAALQSLGMAGIRLNTHADRLQSMKQEIQKEPASNAVQTPRADWRQNRQSNGWLGDRGRNWLNR